MALIPKIKLTFSYKRLQAINTAWAFMYEFPVKNQHDKAMLSLILKLATRFEKKEVNLKYTYKQGNIYNITLEYYEAYFMEIFFRRTYMLFDFGFERTVAHNISNILHQKLA